MVASTLVIPPEDLDEASIYFYRLWARALLGVNPEALVLYEPEYLVLSENWVLHSCRECISCDKVREVMLDTGKPVICACPSLPDSLSGLDVTEGIYRGPTDLRCVVEALARSAAELPPAAKKRDPEKGRWITTACGTFEVWEGRQGRLICSDATGRQFGYTWDPSQQNPYFFRSKSCRKQGQKTAEGSFKLSEQKRGGGKSYRNLDLQCSEKGQAALMRLVPAGAGYKVFPRQLPLSFSPITALGPAAAPG